MKIKVCGITSIEQMQELPQLGVDYAGMIFFEGSKRFVGKEFGSKKSEVRNTAIKKVGVFVNTTFDTIVKAIDDYDLYAIQLHGDETDEFCMELMDKVKVVKAFRLYGNENIDELAEPFQNACHYFLFDTDRPPLPPPTGENGPHLTSPHGGGTASQPLLKQDADKSRNTHLSKPLQGGEAPPLEGFGEVFYGGTGKQFNWKILENAKINKPFFLSGGIGPGDAIKIKAFEHPYFYAVDVNSCFEIEPGIKDMQKIEVFVNEIHHG